MLNDMAISFLAGLFSFVSPCVFPLIPAYLSYIGGVSYQELREDRVSRFTLFFKTLVFVLGFSLVFIVLGLLSRGIGTLFYRVSPLFYILAGVIIILFGLHFIFDFLKFLNSEKRINIKKIPAGYAGALVMGVAFGAGWTPCIGPLLGSILIRASTKETALVGIMMLGFYSAGIGIPFLLAGLFFSFFSHYMKKMQNYHGIIKKICGGFLILLGCLIMSGSFGYVNEVLMRIAVGLENWRQKQPLGPVILFSLLFLGPAVSIFVFYVRKILINKQLLIYPVRIFFFTFFFTVSLLTFTRVIDMVKLIYYWINFSGI